MRKCRLGRRHEDIDNDIARKKTLISGNTRSFAGPHSKLNFVDVVIGEFACGCAVGEFCDYFLFSVEEESADAVETVVLEVSAVGRLVEDCSATRSHKTHALDVPLSTNSVAHPLSLVYGNTV
jgi:hypothetical protein